MKSDVFGEVCRRLEWVFTGCLGSRLFVCFDCNFSFVFLGLMFCWQCSDVVVVVVEVVLSVGMMVVMVIVGGDDGWAVLLRERGSAYVLVCSQQGASPGECNSSVVLAVFVSVGRLISL